MRFVVVKTIAVIGATVTGCAFARVAAVAGYETVLEDVSREMRDRGLLSISEWLRGAVGRGELSEIERASTLRRIRAP